MACSRESNGLGVDLIAAKIYRPRRNRAMKNYGLYQQGRHLTADKRLLRALKKKTRRSKQFEDSTWLRHKYKTLQTLYNMGGDEHLVAPLLQEITLEPGEAQPFFDRIMNNIELFLSCDFIHGDLSAFNILYWDGDFKIIDFPQAVDPLNHPSAFNLFIRDVERICQYFERYGIQKSAIHLATDLWERYMRREL